MRLLLTLAVLLCVVVPASAGTWVPIFEEEVCFMGTIGPDVHFGLDRGTFDVLSIAEDTAIDLVSSAPNAPAGGATAYWHQCDPQGALPAILMSKGYTVEVSNDPMP